MANAELLEFYDKNKNGKIPLNHGWASKEITVSIPLEFLYQMFKAVHEREKAEERESK